MPSLSIKEMHIKTIMSYSFTPKNTYLWERDYYNKVLKREDYIEFSRWISENPRVLLCAKESQRKRCEDRSRGQSNSISGSQKPRNVGNIQKLEKRRKPILPWSLQKEIHSTGILILALWDPFWIPELQNSKIRNLCCFKSLCLWSFVTATIRNWYKSLGKEYQVFPLKQECDYLNMSKIHLYLRSDYRIKASF